MKTKLFLFGALAAMLLAGCKGDPAVVPGEYAITVPAAVNGKVSVTVDDVAVDRAMAGTGITLIATPDEGYGFVKWIVTGATPVNEKAATTTFIMPEGFVTVEAEFAEADYTITVMPAANGSVTASDERAVPGTQITIIAIPDEGYELVKWMLTGVTPDDETSDRTTFIMPEGDVIVAAEFAETKYDITITPAANGTIAVSADGVEVETAAPGTRITITATPDRGYDFVKWTLTGATPASGTSLSTTFTMPEGDVTVAAGFAKTQYSITVIPPVNGRVAVTASGASVTKAAAGTPITITATPNEGYAFVKWTTTGATPASDTDKITTFTMPEGTVTVAAEFRSEATSVDEGVLINGVRWATRNLDAPGKFAEAPQSAGMFYQWGRNLGWSGTDPRVNSNGGTTWDNTNYVGNSWTAENDPSPSGWRLPTIEDFAKLADTSKVRKDQVTTPAAGFLFTDIASGKSVFFPFCGLRNSSDGSLLSVGTYGRYWAADPSGNSEAYYRILSYTGTFNSAISARNFGCSLRLVANN